MATQWNNTLASDNTKLGFGLSIIPVSSSKIPFCQWKQYQFKTAPVENWYNHYQNQATVGIIAGWVSQNIECIDIDIKNDPLATIYEEYKSLIPEDLFLRLIIQTTPNHGYHFIYRCPDAVIDNNQKLALHSNQQVIIKSIGDGYFCTNKLNNQILQGQFDLSNPSEIIIPIITPTDREFLLETAKSLTRYFPKPTANLSDDNSTSMNANRFIDNGLFNENYINNCFKQIIL
jgi:hypothetical protein